MASIEDFTEIVTKEELNDLEDNIKKQKEKLEAISKALEKELKNQESAEKDYDESKKERISVIEEKDVKDRELKKVSSRVKNLEFEVQEGEKTLDKAREERELAEKGLSEAKAILEKSIEDFKSYKEQSEDKNTEYNELTQLYDKESDELADLKEQLATAEPGSNEAEDLAKSIAEVEDKLANITNKRNKVKEDLDFAVAKVEELEKALPGLEDAVPQAENRLVLAEKNLEDTEDKHSDLKVAFVEERDKEDDLKSQVVDLEGIIREVTEDSEEKFADLIETNKAVEKVTNDYNIAKAELIKLESGDIQRAYEEQQASRIEFVEETVPSTKIDAVLFDRVTPPESEAIERDRSTIKNAIYEALDVEDKGDNVIQASVQQARDQEGMLRASQALELTRKSIFSVEKVMEEIIETAKAGKTSIVKKSNEITAPTILTLIDLQYSVTHKKVAKVGRNAATIEFTISWAAAGGASK